MSSANTKNFSLLSREHWPGLAIGIIFIIVTGFWLYLPPTLLGLAIVWPFRVKIISLFSAKHRWERVLAIGFSGFLAGIFLFLAPYIFLLKKVI